MNENPTPSPASTAPPTPDPSSGGRPRFFNEFKRRDICMYIAFGCGLEGAARFVGCSAITIRREARRDPAFRDQLRRAQQDCEIGPLNTIRKAAHENWRASAWYLERMNPQQFGKKNVRYVTPEQLGAFAHQVVTAVLDNNVDEDTRLRAMSKLEAFVAQLDVQSPDHDPLSKLSRRRKHERTIDRDSLPHNPVGGVSDADPRAHVGGVSDADQVSSSCSPNAPTND
jgi:hypothetical protein